MLMFEDMITRIEGKLDARAQMRERSCIIHIAATQNVGNKTTPRKLAFLNHLSGENIP